MGQVSVLWGRDEGERQGFAQEEVARQQLEGQPGREGDTFPGEGSGLSRDPSVWSLESRMCRGLQDHPQMGGFARRTPRTQQVVTVTSVMCHSEGQKAQSVKGEARGVKAAGTRHRLPEPSPGGSHWADFAPRVRCPQPGTPSQDSAPRVFIAGTLCLARTPDSRKESRCQHKLNCFTNPLGQGVPLICQGEVGAP